nr:MAG TPA: hypothetical protein [Caudoviricetes sp.]
MKANMHGSTFITNTGYIRRTNRNHIHVKIPPFFYSAGATACT